MSVSRDFQENGQGSPKTDAIHSADVLGTLLIHLDGRSKAMRKPVGYSFLLNNCRSTSK